MFRRLVLFFLAFVLLALSIIIFLSPGVLLPPSLGSVVSTSMLASSLLMFFVYWRHQTAVVVVNLGLIALILCGFEFYLSATDPARNLPFNGFDQHRNVYTWGQLIVNNSYGFREREFEVTKPDGIHRIMVLGDSLTWGEGLALEQRYTNLLEEKLGQDFPNERIQVLNFALRGLATVHEREILRDNKDLVRPDLIVVGFCLNDPQPRGQDYTVERGEFDRQYGLLVKITETGLVRVGLRHVAARLDTALTVTLERLGIVPPWQTGIERTYDPNSREWADFEQALRDIKRLNDDMDLPAPIFIILNQGSATGYSTNYSNPQSDKQLVQFLRWYHQAEQSAKQAGFVSVNVEDLLAANPGHFMTVNILDGHPSAWLDEIYAQRLFELIGGMIKAGELFK